MLEKSIMSPFIWVLIFPEIHGILQLHTAAGGLEIHNQGSSKIKWERHDSMHNIGGFAKKSIGFFPSHLTFNYTHTHLKKKN